MSDTTWSHQNKEWRKTLDLARAFGWDPPKKLNAHGGLMLKCPAGDRRHQVRVYSTGGGTESVAIDFRKKIRACPHRDLSEPLRRIEANLADAEHLLDAIERHLAIFDAEARMEALVEGLDQVADRLDSAQEEFDAAAAAAADASDGLEERFLEEDPRDLAREAGTSLREAGLSLRDEIPGEHPSREVLVERHAGLSARLEELRARLRRRE